MNLGEIKKLLDAEALTGGIDFNLEIRIAKASDLMSDVLSYCDTDCDSRTLLITGLINNQVVRTAEVADICAIIFVRGKRPSEETIKMAQETEISLFTTELSMYEACGLLFSSGLEGVKS